LFGSDYDGVWRWLRLREVDDDGGGKALDVLSFGGSGEGKLVVLLGMKVVDLEFFSWHFGLWVFYD